MELGRSNARARREQAVVARARGKRLASRAVETLGALSVAVAAVAAAGCTQANESQWAVAVERFEPGKGAGFGAAAMPDVVLGPPRGEGELAGSLDVVSLGVGGEVVLDLGEAVVDGPGPDLVVFENAFWVGGNPELPWKELGEVAVSPDGEEWRVFECDPTRYAETSCAGWRPVYLSTDDPSAAWDPAESGGDPFDLEELGVDDARYVRVRSVSSAGGAPMAGFDLDAVGAVRR